MRRDWSFRAEYRTKRNMRIVLSDGLPDARVGHGNPPLCRNHVRTSPQKFSRCEMTWKPRRDWKLSWSRQVGSVGSRLRSHQYVKSVQLSLKLNIQGLDRRLSLGYEGLRLSKFALRGDTRITTLLYEFKKAFVGRDLLLRVCEAHLQSSNCQVGVCGFGHDADA